MSDAVPLPPHPDLEQYKRLAKELLAAARSGEPDAVASWALQWLDRLAATTGRSPGHLGTAKDRQRYAGNMQAYWSGERDGRKMPPPRRTLAGAQFFLARAHGFESWPKFAKQVTALSTAGSPDALFEAAADAIVTGDIATLRALLNEHPALVRARTSREHNSTLLHYVSANGIEDFRQRTPANIVEIAGLLLDRGADVHAESNAYGGGATPLGLTATSIHPQRAGVMIPLLETLLAAGADLHHRDGGWPIVRACLANGQPDAARYLAKQGAEVNLADAAGIGRLDLVREYLAADGTLRNGATAGQLAEAWEHATWYGHLDIVRYLLDAGVDPALASESGATALHRAAYAGQVDVVELLLQRGAPTDVRDTTYGTTPLTWALHAWQEEHRGPEEQYRRIVGRLGGSPLTF